MKTCEIVEDDGPPTVCQFLFLVSTRVIFTGVERTRNMGKKKKKNPKTTWANDENEK